MGGLTTLLEQSGYSTKILDKGIYECRICGASMDVDQGLCESCAGDFIRRRSSEVESIRRCARSSMLRAEDEIKKLIAEKAAMQETIDRLQDQLERALA